MMRPLAPAVAFLLLGVLAGGAAAQTRTAGRDVKESADRLEQSLRRVDEYLQSLRRDQQKQVDDRDRDLKVLQDDLVKVRQAFTQKQVELEAMRTTAREQQKALDERIAELESRIAAARTEVDNRNTEQERRIAELVQARDDAQRQAADLKDRLGRVEQELAAAVQARDAATKGRDDATSTQQRLQDEVVSRDAALADLRRTLAARDADLDTERRTSQDRQTRIAQLEAELTTARDQLAAESKARTALLAELAGEQQKVAALRQEVERDLLAARHRITALEGEIEALRQQTRQTTEPVAPGTTRVEEVDGTAPVNITVHGGDVRINFNRTPTPKPAPERKIN